ncbi:hypothetical protein P691DRAFT_702658 [Macrolepiota fuliginosa MF-IS2]|uniref:Indole-diterpene biosynthesis protein PaxU n=1 Tax=Macrolepiota fuliginosa MF-IS2 TaxID=1400762 RepID=A0A9P5XG64_9AGAR|nr:hypothetical protein P691DRAFT_702658 [Macrolepiota fuliginosa MF-IS2]
MGAKLLHLQKYTSSYQKRYPNTTIILVRSEAAFFWSTEHAQRKDLVPVVEILEATGSITSTRRKNQVPTLEPSSLLPKHRVLVHAFSNGGCCQLATLSKILSESQIASSSTGTTGAIVLDSCPGTSSLSSAQRAFASAVSHPLMRILARILITLLYCFELIMRHVFRKRSIIQRMKHRLNDPQILPWTGKNTPRLYIYSEGDDLVAASAVEEHIADAREKGLNVQAEKYGKESRHVAHARTDPGRYWGAIGRIWEEALELEERNA